ncbi:MAG: hypothetical protein JNJ45_12055 [Chthonomonas sp.]|nr:hypothetical protein [Chthonomonas sp.]
MSDSFFPSWQTMVTRAIAQPAWMGPDAPDHDVVISSRVRLARNLQGHRFPHHCGDGELREVLLKVQQAVAKSGLATEWVTHMSTVEQNYMVACRLISKDFRVNEPGRALVLDEDRLTSTLVNEEDHLRIQSLSAGRSLGLAQRAATYFCERLGRTLDFAATPELGHLTASPANSGEAIRRSVLVHLVALAHRNELKPWVDHIVSNGLILRGLYGEATRATGALFQLSSIRGDSDRLEVLLDDLLKAERQARAKVKRANLAELVEQATTFATTTRSLSHADAMRVLSWVRWGATRELASMPSARAVDERVATLEAAPTDTRAGRWRADMVRQFLGL